MDTPAQDPQEDAHSIRFSFGVGHTDDAIVEVPFTSSGFTFQTQDKEALFQFFQELFSSGDKQAVLVVGNPGVAVQTISFAAENRSVGLLSFQGEYLLSQNDIRYATREMFNTARYTSLKQGGMILLLDLSFSDISEEGLGQLQEEIHHLQLDSYPIFLCVVVENEKAAMEKFVDPLLFHSLIHLTEE